MSNGELGETPGVMGPQVEGAGGAEERREMFAEERGREQIAFLTELLKDPTVTPEVGAVLVRGEFLTPAEKGGLDISSYEADPLRKTLLTRTGTPVLREQLAAILASQKEQAGATVEELKKSIKEAKEAGSTDSDLEELRNRLENARKAEKTERILELRLGEASEKEAPEWQRFHDEVRARVSLQQAWRQRVTAAAAGTDMYAEQLFNAAFTVVYPAPSEIATIFEIPEVGEAADLILETYLDIHLNRGEFGRERKGLEEQIASERDEKRKKAFEQELKNLDSLKILQAKDPIPIVQERAFEYVQNEDHCGSNKKWVQESADVLARHYLEFDLMSNWLAVARDGQGNIDYSQAVKSKEGETGDTNIGFGLFEGDAQPSGSIWLVLTRLKYLSELSKNRPVGPRAMAPVIPEFMTKPLLLSLEGEFDKDGVLLTADGTRPDGTRPPKKEITKKSLFECWYQENKKTEDEIWEKVKSGEIDEATARERYGQARRKLAEFYKCVNEGAITYWAYQIFRQNQVLKAFKEGDRTKMLAEIWTPEALRSLGKAFQVAYGDRIIERELAKINLIGSRIVAYEVKTASSPDVRRRNLEAVGSKDLGQAIPTVDVFVRAVKQACEVSGFFQPLKKGVLDVSQMDLLDQVIQTRQALTPRQLTQEQLAALLHQVGEEAPLVKTTDRKTVAEVIEEFTAADKKVAEMQEKINKKKKEIEDEEGKPREFTSDELVALAGSWAAA